MKPIIMVRQPSAELATDEDLKRLYRQLKIERKINTANIPYELHEFASKRAHDLTMDIVGSSARTVDYVLARRELISRRPDLAYFCAADFHERDQLDVEIEETANESA